ncbi:MAG: hypothetical protein JSS10_01700 [Verrucomicrobia bacterium]|nr:hypothetical protein [Verrucomicrobiota bacterium]
MAANAPTSGIEKAGDYDPARNDLCITLGEIKDVLTLIQDRPPVSIIGRSDNNPQGLWERCCALSDAITCQLDTFKQGKAQGGVEESVLLQRIQGLQQKASQYRICGLNIDRSTS